VSGAPEPRLAMKPTNFSSRRDSVGEGKTIFRIVSICIANVIKYREMMFRDQTAVGTLFVHIFVQNRSVNKVYHHFKVVFREKSGSELTSAIYLTMQNRRPFILSVS
jgi:hypothetical protein